MNRMDNTNKISFGRVRSVFFFTLIFLLTISVLYLIRPFIYPVFWAAVIAVMFFPLYTWILKYLKREKLSSALTLVIVLIIIFIPLTLLSALLVNESIDLYNKVTGSGIFQNPQNVSDWIEKTPLAPYVEQVRSEWTVYASKAAQWLSQFLFTSVRNIAVGSTRFLVMSFVMLYTLYYFLKDGLRMLKRMTHLSPLGDDYESMLYSRFTSTARATLKSTLIVGGIQGSLAGIFFWVAGVEGAFVWGVIMVIMAIIPAIGPALVLIPAGIIMLALGNVWQGILLLTGSIVVSFIDNLIRPPLVGRDTQMHPLIVFFATLGGLIIFGISGFVIGPIIAALYISVMSIYEHYYRNELQNN